MRAAGAEAAAVTSMGGHFCVKELMAISPLPILNAIPEVDAALARKKLKKIGIIGTRTVMESKLYGGIPSVEVVPTEGEDLDRVHANYVEMATSGHVRRRPPQGVLRGRTAADRRAAPRPSCWAAPIFFSPSLDRSRALPSSIVPTSMSTRSIRSSAS